MRTRGRLPKLTSMVLVLAAGLSILFVLHQAVVIATGMTPPAVSLATVPVTESGGIRHLWNAYTRVRGGVREVYLEGTPEQIGTEQTLLNYDLMVANERALWGDFSHYVPFGLARTAIMDL